MTGLSVFSLMAGHETTSGLISSALAIVLSDEALRAELSADASRYPGAIEEIWRAIAVSKTNATRWRAAIIASPVSLLSPISAPVGTFVQRIHEINHRRRAKMDDAAGHSHG